MSDHADLAQMGEPELRAWLERLPAQELVEIIVNYVRAFLRDGVDDFGASNGALGGLLEMSFPQIISYLKDNTRLPELSRLRVEGDEVKFQTAAGSDILINATGLQDGPGVPGLTGRGGFARSVPDPNRTLRPQPAAAPSGGAPGVDTDDDAPPRPAAPRRFGGGLFDGGGSGTGETGNEPPVPRARSTGRPPVAAAPGAPAAPSSPPPARPAAGPSRPMEPPRVRPDAKAADKKGDKKGGGGKKDDRFSMLEFD